MRIRESEECGKSELDLFTIPPTQTAMEEARWDLVKPFSNFNQGTITFDIEGDNQCYIDLSQTELLLTCKLISAGTHLKTITKDMFTSGAQTSTLPKPVAVTKAEINPETGVLYTDAEVADNTAAITAVSTVVADTPGSLAPVNNFFHSIFQQVQVRIGNVEVENTNSNYPYRAYIENLLCYDGEAKKTFLQNEMWYKDTARYMEDVGTKNEALERRRNRYNRQGGAFHMKGKLKSDIFNMNRYMLPQVNIQVILTRSDLRFCMMGPWWAALNADFAQLKLEITDATLQVRRVKVNPAITMQHAMMLEKTAAKYPVKRVIMRSINTPFNATSFILSGIHRGIMPSRVIVGFVETSAFTGTLHMNPFNFLNLDIKSLKLKMASVPIPYSDGVQTNYKDNQYIEAYDALFQNVRNMGNDISYEDFKHGYSLYAFDLTPDLCNSEHFNMLRDGALEIECTLDKAFPRAFQTICYLEFDNIIEINKERGVQFDFSIV